MAESGAGEAGENSAMGEIGETELVYLISFAHTTNATRETK